MSADQPPRTRWELVIGVSVGIGWTILIALFALGFFGLTTVNTEKLALHQARALFQAVVDFRSWAADHGGVYVPTSDTTHPNPYLPVDQRAIETTDGRQLALVNPAMMTRQAAEVARAHGGTAIRITSLKPLRPANAPTGWEREALEALEAGSPEYARFIGDREFRFMAPLKTEAACLTCHAKQGYRVGDVRGGISVTAPAAPFVSMEQSQRDGAIPVIGAVWLLGLVVILGVRKGFRQKRRLLAQAQELSLSDPLTSVSNRRGFVARAEQAIRTMVRHQERGVLLFIDVDCFKEINDVFGHQEGDAALKRIAELLRETFRESDIIGRLGGDEFAVLELGVERRESAVARSRLEQAIAAENAAGSRPYLLSLSIGMVAFSPSNSTTLDKVLVDADEAMYTEKRRKTSRPDFPAVVLNSPQRSDAPSERSAN